MPKKLLFLLASLLFLGFLVFSYKISQASPTLMRYDFDTTVKFQDRLPHQVDFPFTLISLIGSAEVTAVLGLILFLYLVFKRFFITALSLILMPVSVIIEIYGKLMLYHPSPPHFLYRGVFDFNLPSKYYVHSNYSYPSGHVTRLTFLIVFLMLYIGFRLPKKYQLYFQLTLAGLLVMVCVSRIYLGEHWPSDVVGGLFLGSAFGLLSGLTIPRVNELPVNK